MSLQLVTGSLQTNINIVRENVSGGFLHQHHSAFRFKYCRSKRFRPFTSTSSFNINYRLSNVSGGFTTSASLALTIGTVSSSTKKES